MPKPPEDIIEIKPSFYGIGLNINALWRRFRSKPDPVTIVARRFLQVYQDHGVAISQIPRLVSQLSLEQIRNPESLLPALTPEILQQTADLFRIQWKWLDGTTKTIYDRRYCYKDPWAFFEDLKTLKIDEFDFPLVAFCSSGKLDSTNHRDQPVVLVLREKCAQLDDQTIYRYHIQDEFYWGYWKTRIQLKAMIRVWYRKFQIPVPIYRVEPKILEEIKTGRVVPHPFYRNRRLKGADLEDYSLLPSESRQSKDAEEMGMVFEYIEAYKLKDVGKNEARNPKTSGQTAKFR